MNSRDSCHTKAEGLNFNPRKSWKNASRPAVLTHVMDRAACGNQHPGVASPPPGAAGVDKSEEAEGQKGLERA